MRAKKTIVVALAMAFLGACASDAGDGTESVSSSLRDARFVCLVPVDVDGDGRGDVMRSSSFVVTDPATCRDQYNGAVTLDPARLSPQIDAKSIRPQTMPGLGGQTFTAGDGVPPAVAAEVSRFNLHGRERYRDGYNCQQFSRDLERHLQMEGFHATVTAINAGSGPQRFGHMIVDVHIDGTAWWIEPQNGLPYELDDDGDGDVETRPRGGLGPPSEGGQSIEVFENHEEYCQTYPHHCR
jgi:hypothetical protein